MILDVQKLQFATLYASLGKWDSNNKTDAIFEQTMAGIADVILPLMDVKLGDFKLED